MDGDSTMATVHNVWREQRNRRRQDASAALCTGRNNADEKARGSGGRFATVVESVASLSTSAQIESQSVQAGEVQIGKSVVGDERAAQCPVTISLQ
jgi:hypothetical protein